MKTMLITGASRGIGAATALLAARNGFAIALNYLQNREAAGAIVDQIRSEGGVAEALQADVSREGEIKRLFEEVDRRFGCLHSLVNNAGILEPQATFTQIDSDRMNRMLQSNFIGPFLCCQQALQRMSLRQGGEGGTIVNVSSIASGTGAPFEYSDYAASKGALDTLSLGLSKELAEDGIRVNVVRPGFIYTDIHASGGEPGRVDRIKDTLPLKRGGTAEEVAEAILWLASEKSSFSTGIFIDVTGGR